MLKKLLLCLITVLMLMGCQNKPKEEKKELVEFKKLPQLSFGDVDKFYEEKKSGILYFGWVENCGDSVNFQSNYLEDKLKEKPELLEKLWVVNLDKELPEGLTKKELRQPMKEKYDVGYSPTLLLVKEGAVEEKIEWSAKLSDPITGIPKVDLDVFFKKAGY